MCASPLCEDGGRSPVLVSSARDPAPRVRRGENRPEERRALVLERLRASGCKVVAVDDATGGAALERAVTLGVISASKLSFLRQCHAHFAADPSPDASFFSAETAEGDGVVPYFFVRSAVSDADAMERRLAWHATDALTPVFDDLVSVLGADAALCERAAALLASGSHDVYALTTHPGHHASAEHYGGYCFVNNAVFVVRLLCEMGKAPFVVDVDYHAGDGTASLLLHDTTTPCDGSGAPGTCGGLVSLHAPNDYPFVPPTQPWACDVPPGATWDVYEPKLRAALARRPAACDCLVLSLGYDTLAGDPDAREGHRFALQPADFAPMRQVLRECGLPLCVLQEGGYDLANIPAAAEAFWTG